MEGKEEEEKIGKEERDSIASGRRVSFE